MTRPSDGVAALLGAVGFLATDFLVTVQHWPLAWFDPLTGTVSFARFGSGAMMGLYGLLLWCAAGGGVTLAVARWWGRRWDEAATARWAGRAMGWLGLVTLLTVALHVHLLWNRVPVPLELPR